MRKYANSADPKDRSLQTRLSTSRSLIGVPAQKCIFKLTNMAPRADHSVFAARLRAEGKTRQEAREAIRSRYPDLSICRCSHLLGEHWPTSTTTSSSIGIKRKYEPWDPVPLYFFKKDDLADRSLEIDKD